jgi:hypothetical protein
VFQSCRIGSPGVFGFRVPQPPAMTTNQDQLEARLRKQQWRCVLIALLPLLLGAVAAVGMNHSDFDLPWLLLALGLILDGGYCMANSLCSRRRWSQIAGYVLSFAVAALLAGWAVVVAIIFAVRDFLCQGRIPSMGSHGPGPRTLGWQVFDWSVVVVGFLFAILAGGATVVLIATHRQLREMGPPSPPVRLMQRAFLPLIAWGLLFVLLCICVVSML